MTHWMLTIVTGAQCSVAQDGTRGLVRSDTIPV